VLSLVCGLVLIACSKTETTNNSNTTVGSSTTDKPASTATPASAAASTSGDNIGVPECDDFIAKYEACVSSKVPEMVRAQYQASLKQWKDSWKKLAENPQTKPTLASACKQSLEQAKTSLNAFNCRW
jgi:hypothetical protein